MELTFLSGARDDDFQCVDVDITDDSALEGDEVFKVELTTAEAYVMLGNDMAAVSVWDNDGELSGLQRTVSWIHVPQLSLYPSLTC